MGRRLFYIFGALVLLLVVAAAGGLWWAGSEAGLRFALARLQTQLAATGNDLRIEGASGSLYSDVRIDRFNWTGGGTEASGTGLVLRWSPRSLLQRRIQVSQLSADVVDVRLPPPDPNPAPRGPTPMPAAFGLPVTFDVERIAVGELRITPGAPAGQPTPDVIVVRDIGARVAYRDAAIQLEQLGAVTPYGRLSDTRIELGDAPPHRLQAQARFDGEVERIPFDVRLEASGDLDRLEARTSGRVAQADVQLDAALAPLAVMPLSSARLAVTGLDLKQVASTSPSVPLTQIDAQVQLNGEDDGKRWTGEIGLRNSAGGPLFDGRLPVTTLRSKLALLAADDPAARRLQLHDLSLTLPPAPVRGSSATGTPAGTSAGTPAPARAAGSGAPSAAATPAASASQRVPGSIDGTIDVAFGQTFKVAGQEVPEVRSHLDFKAIDAALFGPELPPTALDGSLDLQRNDFALSLAQSEEKTRALLPAGMKAASGAAEVVVRGRVDEEVLRLEEARVRLGQSRLQAQGTAGLTAPHEIAMTGEARRIDLRQWLPREGLEERWRQGLVSGNWSFNGKVMPGLDATLTLALSDSTLAGKPLAADVRSRVVLGADWSPLRVEKTAVDLRLGGNRVRANGALGNATDRMAIDVSLPEPELFDPALRGRVGVTGELTGAFDRLRTQLVAEGDRLSLAQADGTTKVASVRIEANGPATAALPPQAPLDVAIRLRNLQTAGQQLDSLDLNVNGTLAAHRFNLAAAGEGQSAKLSGDGRATLGAKPSWQATLATTTLDGTVPIRMTGPASLRLDAGSADLERFRVAVAGGQAAVDRLAVAWGEKTSLSTTGSAKDLPISRLLALAGTDASADSLASLQALRLDADWNLAGSGAQDLSGDARIALRELQAKAGASLGLTGDNGARVTLKNGQMDGRFDLSLPSLAFSHALTGPDLLLDGRLRIAGSVNGPLAQPQWHANLTGQSLSLLQRSVGWRLTDGVLSSRFEGREFQLQTLTFNSGEGSVSLRGQAGLLDTPRPNKPGGPSTLPLDGRFELTASKFPVPIGPGQRVALSGSTTLSSNADGLNLSGKLGVDHGTIEIQGSAAPALPSDVTLVYPDGAGKSVDLKQGDVKLADAGQPEARPANARQARSKEAAAKGADRKNVQAAGQPAAQSGARAEEDEKSAIRIMTNLAVNLGERLRVTGNGVAARLTGNLQVLGTLPDEPRLAGVINLVEGSYQSYGQNLQIDKGIVRFNGPIDNPALDITAKRPYLPVEVGIAITGTALNPIITLFSRPDMSETDKLAWLVLGTDPKNAPSAAQSLALREAARSLLVKDDGRYKPGIAERLGLDVMNFGYGSDTGPTQGVTESKNPTGLPGASSTSSASAAQQEVVTLGKRIGSRLFVSYEQGVRGLYNLLRIQYTISQRLSLRAQSGSDNALDLMYSYSFD